MGIPAQQGQHDGRVGRPGDPFNITKTTVFRPVAHSPRQAMQAGWHTVHKYDESRGLLAIDRMKTHQPNLTLFRIPSKAKGKMLEQLEGSGITVTTVFGDLSALCFDIARRHRMRPRKSAR
jgi:hypothetical protein